MQTNSECDQTRLSHFLADIWRKNKKKERKGDREGERYGKGQRDTGR